MRRAKPAKGRNIIIYIYICIEEFQREEQRAASEKWSYIQLIFIIIIFKIIIIIGELKND